MYDLAYWILYCHETLPMWIEEIDIEEGEEACSTPRFG